VPKFVPGILALLSEFKRRGGILVVVTHSEAEFVQRDYRAATDVANGRAHVSPNLVFGGNVRPDERKPHPFPVLATISRFGLSKEDLVVVDDLRSGLDMAQAAGVDFVAAGWAHSIAEIRGFLQQRSHKYCKSVHDLGAFLLGTSAFA
jgi:phosphoglycolate phosphatase/pyrophosphatase PpaX